MGDKLQQPFIIKKIHAWITFLLVSIALLSSATSGFSFVFDIEDDLSDHLEEKSFHMPYKELVKEFVPRAEFEAVKEDITEIKTGVNRIEDILLNR